MMERKPRFGINPPSRDIKFKFDKESTKDFGGMIVDRKIGQAAKAKANPYSQQAKPKGKFNGGDAAAQIARYEAKPNRRKKSADVPRQKPVSRRMIP